MSEGMTACIVLASVGGSDASGTPQFGLIAEQVATVNPHLVMRDENGEIYTVRYDAVNAMLLNESSSRSIARLRNKMAN
jgi:hypothetical protein